MFEQPQSNVGEDTPSRFTSVQTAVSNEAFLAAVFTNLPANAQPLLCTFPGDPKDQRAWTARGVGALSSNANNFFNVASFYGLHAKSDAAAAAHCVLFDDIGAKVSLKKLKGFKLSWLIETSPGNYQGGIILKKPIADRREAAALLRMIIDAGLSDPSATGAMTRWARLPVGINGKAKHRNDDGSSFQCRLIEWNPQARYSVDEIIAGLSLCRDEASLSEKATPHKLTPIRDVRKARVGDAALQAEASDVSMAPEGVRNARLYEASLKIGSLISAGCIDEEHARATLIASARQAGLTHVEAAKTISSGLMTGFSNPRAPQERQLNKDQGSKGRNMHDTNSTAHVVQQIKSPPKVSLIQASGISLEPIDWKWRGYIASGKFHLFAGSPSAGKTTLAETFAAIISNGGAWPDGTISEVGNTIIWSGEDDPKDTLVPRLVAAGADCDRVYFIGPVQDGEDKRSFDPSKDIAALETCIEEIGGAALLIIDPIIQAVEGDAHRNNETRRALQPIVDLAEKTGVAVLGIAHLSKGTQGREPLERLNGSLAFGALARIVMIAVVETNPEEGQIAKRFFTRAKSNIGPDGGGYEYAIEQTQLASDSRIITSRVVFGEALEGTARQILATAEAEEETKGSGALNTAVFFLKSILAHGEVAQTRIQAEAEQSGISHRTLARAKKELDISSRKDRFNGGWFWSLPVNIELADEECQAQGCQNSPTKKLGTLGTLRENQSLTRGGVWHSSKECQGDDSSDEVEL